MSKHNENDEMLDFYYSAEQDKLPYLKVHRTVEIDGKRLEYSECMDAGKKLTSNWDDAKFLGTATMRNVEINGVKQ